MKRYLFGAALAALAVAGSGAQAACPTPYTMKDAAASTQNVASINDASNNCLFPSAIKDGGGAANAAAVKAASTAAIATDPALVVALSPNNSSMSATGSAPPAVGSYVAGNASGATGGQLQGITLCDKTATYDASTSGSTQIVAAVASQTIRICGYSIMVGGTATNVKLVDGTGSNCATGTPVNLTPAYQIAANQGIVDSSPIWRGLSATAANRALCVNASAGNAVQAIVYYSIW